MKVFLFCSQYNPISAVVLQYLDFCGILGGVIFPQKSYEGKNNYNLYWLSMVGMGLYRLLHIFFRKIGIKSNDRYLSPLEYLIRRKDIARYSFDLNTESIDDILGKDIVADSRTVVLSCIFPYKITVVSSRADLLMVNIHPGLLPENRGGNPHFWSISQKHGISGFTAHVMSAQFDKGPIVLRKEVKIPKKCTEYGLEKRIAKYLKLAMPELIIRLRQPAIFSKNVSTHSGHYYNYPTSEDRQKYKMPSYWSFCDFLDSE